MSLDGDGSSSNLATDAIFSPNHIDDDYNDDNEVVFPPTTAPASQMDPVEEPIGADTTNSPYGQPVQALSNTLAAGVAGGVAGLAGLWHVVNNGGVDNLGGGSLEVGQ